MNYRDVAARVLFGSKVLNNAIRGHYIEALAFDALQRYDDERGLSPRWHYVGLNWGPWDLQRGAARDNSRVRFQVRAKAFRQLWEPETPSRLEYDLGWKTSKKLPPYFLETSTRFSSANANSSVIAPISSSWRGTARIPSRPPLPTATTSPTPTTTTILFCRRRRPPARTCGHLRCYPYAPCSKTKRSWALETLPPR